MGSFKHGAVSFFALVAIVFIAGLAGAATGEEAGGLGQYAPKVYAFGDVSYPGPESVNRVFGPLVINRSGYYKIVGTGTPMNRVMVNPGVTADILIEDLTLDVSAFESGAFQISPGASVTLRLAGQNFLKSGGDWAALAAPEGATLTITSAAGDGSLSGALTAIAQYGAGIGGNRGEAGGTITINGGTIHATGSNFDTPESGGAAIGGGWHGDGGTIVINGGAVSADLRGVNILVEYTTSASACIGGGYGGEAGDITINGGFVQATVVPISPVPRVRTRGIGSGGEPRNRNANGKITIAGGVITASGIGGGYYGNGGTIAVSGGVVVTTGNKDNAGIGSGYYGDGGTIDISGGVVTAKGTYRSAGIGSGRCDLEFEPYYQKFSEYVDAGSPRLTIFDNHHSGTIAIRGGFVTASALGDAGDPAAIGGGAYSRVDSIDISGGVVVARDAPGPSIGPGSSRGAGVGNINLSGGTVFGLGGLPIGKGEGRDGIRAVPGLDYYTPSQFTDSLLDIATGGLVLLADKGAFKALSGTDELYYSSVPNSGILLGSDLVCSGDTTIILSNDLTIPAGATLAVPPGFTLDLNGHTLQNNGQILKAGDIVGGTVSGKVTVYGDNFWPVYGHTADLLNGFYIAPGETLKIAPGQTVTIPKDVTATNDGTIVVEAGGTLNAAFGTLKNRGLVLNCGGTVLGDTNSRGSVGSNDSFGTGGTLTLNGSIWTAAGVAPLSDDFAISADQTLVIPAGAAVAIPGTLVNAGEITIEGTLTVYGTLDNQGRVSNFGTLDNKGKIENTGTVMDYGMFINEQGAVVNNRFTERLPYGDSAEIPFALIHVTSGGTLDNYGVINNFGTILIDGTFINETDGLVNNAPGALIRITESGTFHNKGTVKNEGLLKNEGFLKNEGVIDNVGDGVLENTGVIDNSRGTINGTVSDDGTYIENEDDPRSATDITRGPVRLVDAMGQVLTDKAELVKQDDGTWVITAPVGTDLSNVALVFSLPDAGTVVMPNSDEFQDFSGGKTVTYTVISADGQKTEEYTIRLRTLASDGIEGTLLNKDASKWRLVESQDADGSVSFVLEAPLVDGIKVASLDVVEAALGRTYSNLTFVPTVSVSGAPVPLGTPVLSISGKAPSLSDLQCLSVSRVEWTLTGDSGAGYFQDINPPVTYADLVVAVSLLISTPSGSSSGGDDGGCAVFFWPFFAVLCAAGAGVAAARRRRQ
ncbi:MAG: hypothetical protein LBR38_05110 [Synergistaceae bacterium]|jgi:hypothetical protein|nr:hypothetical protein [Synergistaceae bacterium]